MNIGVFTDVRLQFKQNLNDLNINYMILVMYTVTNKRLVLHDKNVIFANICLLPTLNVSWKDFSFSQLCMCIWQLKVLVNT